MRVLLASVDFTPHSDGVSTLSFHYARRLAERGHDVYVVGPRARGCKAEDAEAAFQTGRFSGYGLGLLRFFPFAWCFLCGIRRHRPDVVFAMNIAYGGILCALLKPFTGQRYITMAYAYEFLKFRRIPVLRSLLLRAYRQSECTIVISAFTRQRLAEFGLNPSHMRIAAPGAEMGGRPDGSDYRDGDGPCIGTCGRLIRRKGHELVIRALPSIVARFPGITYLIAGTGPEGDRLQALTAELGVESRVSFLGRLSTEQLCAFYHSLDLFVMPVRGDEEGGHAEGFGIVYLEAALCGVPSIGARTGGVPEAIEDGVTGRLVEPGSVDGIAEAVGDMLATPDARTKMGEAARTRATESFSWDHQVDRVHELLVSLGSVRDDSDAC